MVPVKRKFVFPILLMLVFAASRWPNLMPANFSAAYAIMFCAGLYFPGVWAWVLPFGTMLCSDLLINCFGYGEVHLSMGEWAGMMLPNYAIYACIVALGQWMSKSKRSFLSLMGGGMLGAFLFYLITNSLSWLTLPYAKTIAGWIQALTTGLPGYPSTLDFFRSTLLSGGLFTGLFVGALKILEPAESPEEKREPAPEKASDADEEPSSDPVPEHAKP